MIFDIETDGLNATKIHVMSYKKGSKIKHTHNYEEMKDLLLSSKVLIGHNIILFDIPVLEKILDVKVKAKLIDTLALSWYLNHKRNRHGLEQYGEEFGYPKPYIDDWDNLTPEDYAHRCDEDVKINSILWDKLKKKLLSIYGSKEEADRLISYLSFKMDCVREQERSKWKLDIDLVRSSLDDLIKEQEAKIDQLKSQMPSIKKYSKRKRPAKPYKKDGTLSVQGYKWFELLKEEGLPETFFGEVKVVVGEEEPNPNSHDQVKSWLYSLGWKPQSFKFDGDRKIPQIRVEGPDGKELCPSVKRLAKDHPIIKVLEGLTVLQHRISILKGLLRDNVDGYVCARVGGLTNTLRFKHRELVNLPKVSKPYGKVIRGSLIASKGKILCGSDMSSLEDCTKRHYMYKYDPDYVEEMSKEDFDPHLDLALHAGAITKEELKAYVKGVPEVLSKLKPIRQNFKVTNYSATYGVMKWRLSREAGVSLSEAQKLLDGFWERNWSLVQIAKDTTVKKVDGEMWLFNPVSKLWYSLRHEKDIFSTLNQGTGVYCFDTWVKNFREVRPQLTAQFHDEVVLEIKEGYEEECIKLLRDAINKTNEQLKLNVQLDIDIQFGHRYSEIH